MKLILLTLLILITACSLSKGFLTREFRYSVNSKNYTVAVDVPKGYTSAKAITDSAGNPVQFYYYGNNTFLYVTHVNDSTAYPLINADLNIPLPHPKGGLIYKGMKDNGLFWREIRLNDGLIYGYRNVPKSREIQFDRAVDFSSLKEKAE